ncbi:MAG: hypothetical protein GF398_06705 [Chitinivibrionales bacterium]|nr:hypothetical protein [Chitinivibrionales bacterium]
MLDFIKKGIYTGVGLAYMTKEKVEETAKKLIKESNLTEAEGKKFLDDLLSKADDARKATEKMVNDAVAKALGAIDVATRNDIDKLKERISKLEENA